MQREENNARDVTLDGDFPPVLSESVPAGRDAFDESSTTACVPPPLSSTAYPYERPLMKITHSSIAACWTRSGTESRRACLRLLVLAILFGGTRSEDQRQSSGRYVVFSFSRRAAKASPSNEAREVMMLLAEEGGIGLRWVPKNNTSLEPL